MSVLILFLFCCPCAQRNSSSSYEKRLLFETPRKYRRRNRAASSEVFALLKCSTIGYRAWFADFRLVAFRSLALPSAPSSCPSSSSTPSSIRHGEDREAQRGCPFRMNRKVYVAVANGWVVLDHRNIPPHLFVFFEQTMKLLTEKRTTFVLIFIASASRAASSVGRRLRCTCAKFRLSLVCCALLQPNGQGSKTDSSPLCCISLRQASSVAAARGYCDETQRNQTHPNAYV